MAALITASNINEFYTSSYHRNVINNFLRKFAVLKRILQITDDTKTSPKFKRLHRSLIESLPRSRGANVDEFIASVEKTLSKPDNFPAIVSLGNFIEHAFEMAQRLEDEVNTVHSKREVEGIVVPGIYVVECMAAFPGNRLCCGSYGNIVIIDPQTILDNPPNSSEDNDEDVPALGIVTIENAHNDDVKHIITKVGDEFLPHTITASRNCIKIWDNLEANSCSRTIDLDPYAEVTNLFAFHEGERVCAILGNGEGKVWCASTGQLLARTNFLFRIDAKCVQHIRFREDDKIIAASRTSVAEWTPEFEELEDDDAKKYREEVVEDEEADIYMTRFEVEESITTIHYSQERVFFGTRDGNVLQINIRHLGLSTINDSIRHSDGPISALSSTLSSASSFNPNCIIANDSMDFVYEDGDESTTLRYNFRGSDVWVELEDCVKCILPLPHNTDLVLTAGYSVHKESYYDSSKLLHPCYVWNMMDMASHRGDCTEELKPQHILVGHEAPVYLVCALESGIVAGFDRESNLLLWNVAIAPVVDPNDEDGEEDEEDT